MSSLVSNCCGASYEEDVATCAECSSFNIGEKFKGDEGWTICDDCGAIEQGYNYITACDSCDEKCEIEEEYEYNAKQRENASEDKADARRKYNE